MTNPTSNFGWQMPTPTDLVTDLPADFEVFGQAVDTDLADLLGGANGYILSKASATDLDFAWIPNDQGDITVVNVTAPITGGGSSGAVTIGVSAASTAAAGVVQLSDSTSTTSSVLASTPTATKSAYDLADAAIAKSTLTTAGDVLYRNATVPVRLGIGTAGQVLQVNSGATAPEWATVTSGGMTLLSTTTLSGATTTVSGISGSYNQLYILVTGTSVSATAGAYPSIKPNGSSGICSTVFLFGTGGTVNSQSSATGNMNFHYNNWVLNNTNNAAIFTIDNYASATNYKPWAGHGQYINNSSVTESFNGAGNVLTNTAITSLEFSADTSTFNGGTVKVYGVK